MPDTIPSVKNNFAFSWHPTKPDFNNATVFARGWREFETADMGRLIKAALTCVWSSLVWKDNYRKQKNFLYADWGALDFDGGHRIEQIAKEWCDTVSFIGTTKSHTEAEHRFRLVFRFERRVTCPNEYKHNLQKVTENYDLDECFDGARFFWPCKEIYQVVKDGYLQPVLEVPKVEIARQARQEEVARQTMEMHRRTNTIPKWIINRMRDGVTPGRRNHFCYVVGRALSGLGYGEDEIVNSILSGKLGEKGEEDVRKAVKRGIQRTREGYREDREHRELQES